MPIYEFYCADCHALYSFLARRPGVRTRPGCPRCGRARLERRASVFAISSDVSDVEADGPVDESALETALDRLAGDVERLDENDPRQVGGLMRRLFDAAGLPVGDAMREAIRRMESGEDADAIEADLGDALEHDESMIDDGAAPTGGGRLRAWRRRVLPPRIDRTLHEL